MKTHLLALLQDNCLDLICCGAIPCQFSESGQGTLSNANFHCSHG